jgi:hypothetical protein
MTSIPNSSLQLLAVYVLMMLYDYHPHLLLCVDKLEMAEVPTTLLFHYSEHMCLMKAKY